MTTPDACKNNCTASGLCLNSTCFCNQGKTGPECEYTYKEWFERGFEFKKVYGWLIGALGGTTAIVLTILLIACL